MNEVILVQVHIVLPILSRCKKLFTAVRTSSNGNLFLNLTLFMIYL